MNRIVGVAVAVFLLAVNGHAAHVPGTSVSVTPPDGYVAATRFPGFMYESAGSSIMVSEIPGPYNEATAGFRDAKRMESQGMKLIGNTAVTVDGKNSMLLHIEQPAHGTLFRKWIVAADLAGTTTLISATYPAADAHIHEAPLKAALLGATFHKPNDPAAALRFTAAPFKPFEVAKVIGQNLILTPGGRFPVEDEKSPMMVLGLSATEGMLIQDQKSFAERRATKTAMVKDIAVEKSAQTTIDGMNGLITLASGTGEGAGTPMTIYQVMLFDSSGYTLIQGITPTSDKDINLPIFENIAASFRLKKAQPAARPYGSPAAGSPSGQP